MILQLLLSFILSFNGSQVEGSAGVPGTIIDHSPAATRQYIGSPSIAVLPGGVYVASHDLFGPGSTKDRTIVFESRDRGKLWRRPERKSRYH